MNLLFIGMIVFICVIQVFILNLAGKPHQQVILENTLPSEYLNHPEVLLLTKAYRKALILLGSLFSLLSLSFLLTRYESIQLTLFWFLLFASLASMYVCKIIFIRRMKKLISKHEWQPKIEPKLVDTTLILQKNKKMVSVSWLYLSFFLSLPLAWYTFKVTDFSLGSVLFGSSLFLFLLMLVMYYYIGRIPAKAWTSNSEINQKYNDLTKHGWSFIAILTNWLMLPLLFLPVFMMEATGSLAFLLTVLFVSCLLLLVFFIIGYLYGLRKKQDALLMAQSDYRYSGDDKYWRYGVYINPNDPKLFIPDRIGMNLGINLGRPAGKIMFGITTLLLVATFFFTLIPAYLYDFTKDPLQIENNGENIILSAPFTKEQVIPIEEIEKIELVDEIPRPLTKTIGTATDNYAIGRFSIHKKTAHLFVDYRSLPILYIQTKDADYYYTNKQSTQTILAYETLVKNP